MDTSLAKDVTVLLLETILILSGISISVFI
jgi:hypothetical protein